MSESLRTFDQQFGAATAARISALISRINALRPRAPGGATSFYLYEMSCCLQVGLLLAALHLCSTSLELFVRAKVALAARHAASGRYVVPKTSGALTYQERLEENRKLKLADLLTHLELAGLFRKDDVAPTLDFYNGVRTPLAHGLIQRFTYGKPEATGYGLSSIISGLWGFTSQSELENFVEANAISQIETAIGIMERNAQFRMIDDG